MKMNIKTVIAAAFTALIASTSFVYAQSELPEEGCITGDALATRWEAEGVKYFNFTTDAIVLDVPDDTAEVGVYTDGEKVVIVPFDIEGCAQTNYPPIVVTIEQFQESTGIVLQ
jgi:hypothetical protein